MKKLITDTLFNVWQSTLEFDIEKEFLILQQKELEPHSFTFYTSVSVMSSSKIEGEQMEIDSYVKHKLLKVEYLPELTEKPDDLYKAYLFAKESELTKDNFHEAHKLITSHLLPVAQRGVLRKTEMLVMEHKTGKIQYEAAQLKILSEKYSAFWNDVNQLLKTDLSFEQVLYYAAFIHLVLVNIHPFADGNGRIGRLPEKWFLADKLGERAWYIPSEKYYYNQIDEYYKNLAQLGMFYDELNYQKSIPFLLMLPQTLKSL